MPRRPARAVLLAGVLAATPALADLDDFARCLARKRATYYHASWCPHCAAQDRMFGHAIRYVDQVDCSAPHACADIGGFPTWTFADGSRRSGVAPLSELSRRTGCALSGGSSEEGEPVTRSLGGVTTRERTVGGSRIIEIPGR